MCIWPSSVTSFTRASVSDHHLSSLIFLVGEEGIEPPKTEVSTFTVCSRCRLGTHPLIFILWWNHGDLISDQDIASVLCSQLHHGPTYFRVSVSSIHIRYYYRNAIGRPSRLLHTSWYLRFPCCVLEPSLTLSCAQSFPKISSTL